MSFEDDEVSIVSELEESLEDDEDGGREGGEGHKPKDGHDPKKEKGKKIEQTTMSTTFQFGKNKSGGSGYDPDPIYDAYEEEDYSQSFYPPNDSTAQLNQSTVSFRSKLSSRSKHKSGDEEDQYGKSNASISIHDSSLMTLTRQLLHLKKLRKAAIFMMLTVVILKMNYLTVSFHRTRRRMTHQRKKSHFKK
jgi:hypothetical protein